MHRLHLARSNRRDATIDELLELARTRGVEVREHSREELARISKNGRQDQGVAADVDCPRHRDYRELLVPAPPARLQLVALDRVTNPQNLGMIIRTLCASPLDGLLLPRSFCAPLSPLVIKASAGTLFRCPLWRCDGLPAALAEFAAAGVEIAVLAADAPLALGAYRPPPAVIYVLGNETEGVSPAVAALARRRLAVPMANGVESSTSRSPPASSRFALCSPHRREGRQGGGHHGAGTEQRQRRQHPAAAITSPVSQAPIGAVPKNASW